MSSSIDKVNQLLSGEWVIASKLDQNKVLDLNGGNVVLNDRNGSDTQKWTISYDTGSSIGRSFIIRGIVRKMRIYNVKSIFPADTKGLQVFVSICNSLYFFF
jgi:hypothetical protein